MVLFSFFFDLPSATTFATKEASHLEKITNKTSHFNFKMTSFHSAMLCFYLHHSLKSLSYP